MGTTSGGLPLVPALDRILQERPDLPITLAGERHTVTELEDRARRLAAAISEHTSPGDRVGVMARNGETALLAWWAGTMCGTLVTPYNTSNRGDVLTHQVSDSEPALMITDPEHLPVIGASVAAPHLRLPLILGSGADERDDTQLGPWTVRHDLETVVAQSDRLAKVAPPEPFATSHLIYTSGTTGASKACQVSHGYVGNFARQVRENLGRTAQDGLWTALPLFHLAAVTHTLGSLQVGAPIDIAARFSVTGFWAEVLRSGATTAALMGSMLPMIAAAPDSADTAAAYGRLRTVSGSPVTPELAAVWRERFGVERVGAGVYGMTEAALITSTPAGQYRPGSAGMPSDSFEVRIVGEQDNPLPTGQIGEIVVRPLRPDVMFTGYWRQPERTLDAFRGLWFHCGDYGRFDDAGHLHFVDRGKDYLRRGGENISSVEIEQVIAQHPQVREVAVHAVQSPLAEDDLKVTIVARDGCRIDEQEFFDWVRPRVPRYAVPSHVEVRTQLPKNSVGRVLKHVLRAEGVTAATWSTDPRAGER
ncbi:crotonobetaine/carnitine-CoA ligase [Branchiibius hedensis]|uniref:Crotonobetaine/carnitine-CoA ligase n=1 Tax=Branchiibius hedensis TaxID=672460 RepID=A0A2Y9C2C2_9MICO|nr:AMP-binding protein [Branchiibius hedensis]PWJ27032.1 crotonobetaine/carnitine-CoA ligase [Branchiibius hedensis]SSA35843.1 crotonobetaine/carnitine-CoA ligase [Branchiibius hedensis]